MSGGRGWGGVVVVVVAADDTIRRLRSNTREEKRLNRITWSKYSLEIESD